MRPSNWIAFGAGILLGAMSMFVYLYREHLLYPNEGAA
jgi:hypothetical protein